MLEQLRAELGVLGELLERTESLRLVVKDLHHRYVHVNPGWLESVGLSEDVDVLGKTVFDVFPVWRAERYHEEECAVIDRGETIDTCEEITILEGEERHLWRSLKAPRRDAEGGIIGMIIVGMLIDPDKVRARLTDSRPSVVEWMERHACEPLTIEDIAGELSMSRRKLERLFVRATGETPGRYRQRCRLARARTLLRHSHKTVAAIASECGFYDQSHFSKVFREAEEIMPGAWRRGLVSRA